MIELLRQPWPWYVGGALLGLMVPALLIVGNKSLGISNNLRHACAALLPGNVKFFQYDWKKTGGWNLAFALGILLGGWIAGVLLASPEPLAIAEKTAAELARYGITQQQGLAPAELFSWSTLLSFKGIVLLVGGGFLIGFGTAYGGGCTSGHGLSGLSNFQLPSLIALIGMFAGGLLATHVLLPLLL